MTDADHPDIRAELLSEISAFQKKYDIADTTFGRLVADDPHVLPRMKAGKNFTVRRAYQCQAFMDAVELTTSAGHRKVKLIDSFCRGYQFAQSRAEKGAAA